MNILWLANAPWCRTGYGNQTRIFWHRIQRQLGHRITLAANYGLAGSPLNISEGGEETRVLPIGYHQHGIDVVSSHAKHAKADVVITLYDCWVFDPRIMQQLRWCPWMPIDHDQAPPPVVEVLRSAWQPIAYSRFGEARLKAAGLDPRYVPHGIETDVFAPVDRDKARAALKLPDHCADADFIAVMVAANKGTPSRKAFPEVLMAWKRFIQRHPKALLFLHTHAGPQMAGLDLSDLLDRLEIPERNVVFCDPYWLIMGYPDTYMAHLYNAADVLLSPSYGEGFGIPILEAQACGTPVIVGDWTSMPELLFAGWKVSGQPFWTPQGSWQYVPMIDDIVEALEGAYRLRGYDKHRRDAREGAMAYDADLVTREYWAPVLAEIAEQVEAGALRDDPLELVS